MIAAIGIGIVVDDTIHFLHTFKDEMRRRGDYAQAIEATLLQKGRPIVLTSMALFFGFSVLIFSNFMPVVHIGFLMVLLMATALVGDLIVLPAILFTFKPKVKMV